MRISVLLVFVLAGFLGACAGGIEIKNDRQSGHFGAGLHAGRVDGG